MMRSAGRSRRIVVNAEIQALVCNSTRLLPCAPELIRKAISTRITRYYQNRLTTRKESHAVRQARNKYKVCWDSSTSCRKSNYSCHILYWWRSRHRIIVVSHRTSNSSTAISVSMSWCSRRQWDPVEDYSGDRIETLVADIGEHIQLRDKQHYVYSYTYYYQ